MTTSNAAFDDTLVGLIDDASNRFKDQPCLVLGNESLTYGEVQAASRRVANGLLGEGFTAGMRGAVLSPNDPWAVVATLGIIRARGIWVPINPRNSFEENLAQLEKFGCNALFYHSSFAKMAQMLLERLPEVKVAVSLDGGATTSMRDWSARWPDSAPAVQYDPLDIVSIPMTGGTTGVPKAVALSNRNFAAILRGVAKINEPGPPVFLAAAPMTHVGGRLVLTVMYRGGISVVLPKIEPQIILDAIPRYGITELFLPPTALYDLLSQPNVRDIDYSSVKRILYGAQPMSIEKLKLAIQIFGPVMAGGYGQTEAPLLITYLPPNDHFVEGKLAPDDRLRSVGRPTPDSEIVIVDDDGEHLPAGERGEVLIRGPFVSEGYFENSQATADVRRDGWHMTGDVGYLDEDGYLYLVDRKRDMIITGGFNVYSAEVERIITALPGVRDCVVIGVPDDKWGEAVKAVVMLDSGSKLDTDFLISECRRRLGPVKTPKSVDFVNDLPRTAAGKVDKKKVRNDYWAGTGRSI
jgi:acyl-CoA synthetase (AMP-forming)/AMP-acid ligase II